MPEGAMNLAKVLNICPMNPSGRPISHGDGASGTAHAQQFASYEFRPRGKHGTHQADHDVEAGIFDGKASASPSMK